MDYTHIPTPALLKRLIGKHATAKYYRGVLRALFEAREVAAAEVAPLLVARELVSRWLGEELAGRDALSSPTIVKEYLALHFAGQGHESFVVLFLDAQNRLIVGEELFRGTLSQTAVYPREVVKRALSWNAAAVMLAHNHPSGVAEPSKADELLTKALTQALSLVDVKVLDHLVVAGSQATSFAERGLL
jgi:DNA repair protein RadC